MARIAWIDDDDARGETAEIYAAWKRQHPGRERMPDILKCFSLRPDFLRGIMECTYPLHFEDGALRYDTKEMIATFVSGLNSCPY